MEIGRYAPINIGVDSNVRTPIHIGVKGTVKATFVAFFMNFLYLIYFEKKFSSLPFP